MKIQRYQQQQQQQQHHHSDTSWSECPVSCPSLLFIYDDAICLLLFVCEAFLWRGVWNLNATFMLSDLFVGGWVNHAVGTVLMMTLQVFSYVGVCGCARDDDVPSDEGENYYYCRHNWHAWRAWWRKVGRWTSHLKVAWCMVAQG